MTTESENDDYDSKFGVFKNRYLTNTEKYYFYINTAIFILNIIFGVIYKNHILIITASIALLLSIYVYNANYHHETIWVLDQITVLAVLVPGVIMWLLEEYDRFPIAGMFFGLAVILYAYSVLSKDLVHSTSGETRIKWHVYLHILVTIGHILLNNEKKALAYLMLFI